MIRKPHPGVGTTRSPMGDFMFSSPKAIPMPCTMLKPTVPYRVYWVIFFRPWLSCFSSFSLGTTTAKSCRIIEALI